MDAGISSFVIFLAIIWFLFYWVFGGVFFAVVAILRLGRVRKVRFSCLFTLISIAMATGASYIGVHSAEQSIRVCTLDATSKAKTIIAVIGCGFGAIMGSFLIGLVLLILCGYILMSLSKSKTKPWFLLHQTEQGETEDETLETVIDARVLPTKKSKFF